jgi:hypothetical protein
MKISTFDFETDPFLHGRNPSPFCCGFYDGEEYTEFWGDDCVSQFIAFVAELDEPHILYAHNGGKFDAFFLLAHGVITSPLSVVNGRILKARFLNHEFRDSYAILPIPLAAYEKQSIEYWKFERENREAYKAEILDYLKSDCVYLHELIQVFRAEFGDSLTIGAASIKALRDLHPFKKCDCGNDDLIRPFYYGGRVECFESGELAGDFKIYDVNSMYPHVMRNYPHPVNGDFRTELNPPLQILDKHYRLNGAINTPYFAHVIASNKNCLPSRSKTGLSFALPHGEFFATSHELIAGREFNDVKIEKILVIYIPRVVSFFDEFVDYYMARKIEAEENNKPAERLIAKLISNSAYGKTAQNPRKFREWEIMAGILPPDESPDWELHSNDDNYSIWSRPDPGNIYYDVSIGASITGAARALLYKAMRQCKRVVYCDTDSVICENFVGEIHPSKLGAWKFEGKADRLAIAGKKLYAAFDQGKCVKSAHKGALLSPENIVDIARGGEVLYKRDAPTYSINGQKPFLERRIRKTV